MELPRAERRVLLRRLGWAGVASLLPASFAGFVRFLFPRALFEPEPVFRAGRREDYPRGTVSERFRRERGVWIVHDGGGIYALVARCTHLGCTPYWLEAEGKFKCPCHGSGFTKEGVNFEGPAPRPLERAKVGLDEDGELVVDLSVRFRAERDEWGRPGSFVEAAG